MCKIFKTLVLMAMITFCFVIPVSAAETIKINTLIENMKEFDKQEVTIEGEAIGEAMLRGEYSWINISDDTNATGIWLTASDAKKITYFGDYKHIGDTVRITGTFSRNCLEHGGDVDLHGSSFEIVAKGRAVQEEITLVKIFVAAGLFCAGLIVSYMFWQHRNEYNRAAG